MKITMHMSGSTAEYMRTSAGRGWFVHRPRLAFMPTWSNAVKWATLEAASSCIRGSGGEPSGPALPGMMMMMMMMMRLCSIVDFIQRDN